MSGTMQPQMGGMGGQQQMSPQIMAMLAAASQRGGQPQGAPQQGPQMPMSGPVPGMGAPPPGQPQAGPPGPQQAGPVPMPQQQGPMPAQPMSGIPPQSIAPPVGTPQSNLQMFGQAASGAPAPAGQGMRMSPGEMAHMGRFGDSVLAHLTPGEMAIPPEAQTKQVMDALTKAFGSLGVNPSMFRAGSPQSSVNPQTGANEYSILGALLPVIGAIGGSIIPGVGTAVGAGLGGAAGGALGGVVDHTGAAGIGLGALGGGVGGYLGAGGAFGGSAAATPAASATLSGVSPDVDTALANASASTGTPWTGSSPSMMSQIPWKAGIGAGIGSTVGSAIAPQSNTASATPPGFNTPMAPLNPQYGQLLGSNQANRPSFAGYNPYTSVTGSGTYNFFPQS